MGCSLSSLSHGLYLCVLGCACLCYAVHVRVGPGCACLGYAVPNIVQLCWHLLLPLLIRYQILTLS